MTKWRSSIRWTVQTALAQVEAARSKADNEVTSTANMEFSFLIVAIVALLYAYAAAATPKRPGSLGFYWRDTLQNKTHPWTNTAVEVAGPGHNITGLGYGRVIVFNDPLTVDSSHESQHIGKAQGMYLYDQFDLDAQPLVLNAMLVFSALIETEEYKGTLNFMGADVLRSPTRDISVIGGTGDFEVAHGIATLRTHSIVGDTFIVQMNVTLVY